MKKQINGTEKSPDIHPHKYSQLIFNKGTKAIQIVLEQLDITYKKQKNQCRHKSYILQKITSKRIVNLNVKQKTIKLLGDNVGEKSFGCLKHFGSIR